MWVSPLASFCCHQITHYAQLRNLPSKNLPLTSQTHPPPEACVFVVHSLAPKHRPLPRADSFRRDAWPPTVLFSPHLSMFLCCPQSRAEALPTKNSNPSPISLKHASWLSPESRRSPRRDTPDFPSEGGTAFASTSTSERRCVAGMRIGVRISVHGGANQCEWGCKSV